ncbi:RNA polymerase subunit sigma-70 [Actinoplanes sp. NPDC026619]|uniref:RNA polymerase subunit sigma-70 n=1 Tax=Actinoplanes sp. NPDC026619 TaxID=3155798 RepID=UPI00340DD3C3
MRPNQESGSDPASSRLMFSLTMILAIVVSPFTVLCMSDMETPRGRKRGRMDFRELVEPYHRELRAHCYRMLGSLPDAEDALQETLLAAWQGLDGFEERSSVRTWLYRIATNRCLNLRRSAARRPPAAWDVPAVDPIPPTRLGEITWLTPFPTTPEDGYERREDISLAFVTALQALPPRQVAVLLLRDVLDFPAGEVAAMLDTTTDSVKSALKRARAGLSHLSSEPAAASPAEAEILARFVRAWEAADIAALVELLTDDVFITMPPIPFEYVGRDLVARFCAALFAAGRRFDLTPSQANGQPAYVARLHDSGAPAGLYVLTLRGPRISALTRFDATVLRSFGAKSLSEGEDRAALGAQVA